MLQLVELEEQNRKKLARVKMDGASLEDTGSSETDQDLDGLHD